MYYRQDFIEQEYPAIFSEWMDWLDANIDPGHYDSYKEKDPKVLPYIDGKPQWVCAVCMPPHIEEKLPSDIRHSNFKK